AAAQHCGAWLPAGEPAKAPVALLNWRGRAAGAGRGASAGGQHGLETRGTSADGRSPERGRLQEVPARGLVGNESDRTAARHGERPPLYRWEPRLELLPGYDFELQSAS